MLIMIFGIMVAVIVFSWGCYRLGYGDGYWDGVYAEQKRQHNARVRV